MTYIKLLSGGLILAFYIAMVYFAMSYTFQYKIFSKLYFSDVQSKIKVLVKRGVKEEEARKLRPAQPVIDHFAWQYRLSLVGIHFLGVVLIFIYWHLSSYLLTQWMGFSLFWAGFTKYIFIIQFIVPYIILGIGNFVVYLYFNRYVKKSDVYGYYVSFDLDDTRNFARTWLTRLKNHEESSEDYFRRMIDPTIGMCYIIFAVEVVVMFIIRLFS